MRKYRIPRFPKYLRHSAVPPKQSIILHYILPIGGAVLSVIAVVVSISTANEQVRQWRSTSLGTVSLKSARFISFKAYAPTEIRKIDFGYEADFEDRVNPDGEFSDKLYQVSELVAVRKGTLAEVSRTAAPTMKDLDLNLAREKVSRESVDVKKRAVYQLIIRKLGATPARSLRVTVDRKSPVTGEWINDVPNNESYNLFPEEEYERRLFLYFEPEERLPDTLYLRIKIEYFDASDRSVVDVWEGYYGGFRPA